MNRKDRQREQILQHGFDLIRVFNLPDNTLPVTLCKAVHRIETKIHRLETDVCNGVEQDDAKVERIEKSALKRLDKILNFKAQGIPVIINGDPRGYALKIDSEYVRTHNIKIHQDWGGYGIIAPEFNGN